MNVRVGIQLGAAHAATLSSTRLRGFVESLEELGFDSLWISERLSGPTPAPLVALTAALAWTSRLKAGTSVLVVPGYNPVHLAKALASADVMSNGRVLPGVGIGLGDRRELEAVQVDKSERGRRLDEAIMLMKRLWLEEQVTHAGRFYRVTDFTLLPRPVGPLPHAVWAGGSSTAAHRRVGRLCDGWLPSYVTPDEVRTGIEAIRQFSAEAGRQVPEDHYGALVPVSLSDSPTEQVMNRRPMVDTREYAAFGAARATRELLQRYVEAGATKIVLVPMRDEDLQQLERIREEIARPLEEGL